MGTFPKLLHAVPAFVLTLVLARSALANSAAD
jgi:hypothetical protein